MRALFYLLPLALLMKACDQKPPTKANRLVMVTLPPPVKPLPIPPPVQQPPPPEQKVAEPRQFLDNPKPDVSKPEPPKAPDEPPPTLGSGIKGDGKDGFDLSGSGNGGRVGLGGNGSGGGSPYSRYLAQVQGGIAGSLRQDKRTRSAVFEMKVRVWIDSAGRITRAEPAGGKESAAAAAALVGQRVADRPPEGLPMPVLARLAARRPN